MDLGCHAPAFWGASGARFRHEDVSNPMKCRSNGTKIHCVTTTCYLKYRAYCIQIARRATEHSEGA